MALTVSNLYKESVKYKMKLLAGGDGLGKPVQWVHIVENIEDARFLHGNEVVITEGILEGGEEKLLAFAETLYAQNASALVVKTGMFVSAIPDCVAVFCNAHGFPLFSVPKQIPIVDVTRDCCQRIMDNGMKEDTVITAFKNLIFHTGDKEALLHQMERFGYMPASTMMFLCFSLELEKGTEEFINKSKRLKALAEGAAKVIKDRYISFEYQEKRIVALINYAPDEADIYIGRVCAKLSADKMLSETFIGVGENIKGLECQDDGFMRAYAACEIACKKREHVLRYKELGIYKLLANITDIDVLGNFYQDSFGKIIRYDMENGTDHYNFIRTYIECNGHHGSVSDRLYIHRNTVNNYIRKIEEITDMDLFSWEGRARLYTAYCIGDML